MKDLWGGENGKAYIKNKQPDRNWELSSKSAIKRSPWEARVRPSNPSQKNAKAAVPLPHGGQSYHPSDETHQQALQLATKNLLMKKAKDEKWIKSQMINEDDVLGTVKDSAATSNKDEKQSDAKRKKKSASNGGAQDDAAADAGASDSDADDENQREQQEAAFAVFKKEKMTRSQVLEEKKKKTRDQKLKHGKKLSKSELADRKRHALALKRQPNQIKKNKDVDRIDEIADEVGAALFRSHQLAKHRKQLKKRNQTTVSFGRHHHQPLALEVAPTTALTGSLRQLMNRSGANAVVHPVVDRMKSLEARNMIPAKMRHKYNKKKVVVAPGEVKVVREAFGTMPDSSKG